VPNKVQNQNYIFHGEKNRKKNPLKNELKISIFYTCSLKEVIMAQKKETKAKTTAKPAAKARVVKETAPKAKKTSSKGKTREIEFKAFSPASGSVAVAGDFNSWKPFALKKGKNGNWSGNMKLSEGIYQYKLVFDGQYWETDSANPERVSDGHGGENSVVRV
jgi:1,4-alpha-glucan branching enzyme